MPASSSSMGSISGTVSNALAATGHQSGRRLGCAGFAFSTSVAP